MPQAKSDSDVPPEVREALALCDDLLDLIEDLPPGSWELGEHLMDRVRQIALLVEESNRVTPAQLHTLEHLQVQLERRTRRR